MSQIHLRLLGSVELTARERERDGDGARPLSLAPKPLALLAYLAVTGGRPVRRDLLLALFWPELPEARARAALRQQLLRLRRALGARTLRANRACVALAPEAFTCDAIEFERLLARDERVAAVEMYRGALLEGFHVDGTSRELEGWVERERARLARRATLACSALADEAMRARNGIAAAHWARRAASLAPDDEIAVRRLIGILDAFGDRAGALRAADEFARRLTRELGAEPSAETQALVAAVRARSTTRGAAAAPIPASPGALPDGIVPTAPARPAPDVGAGAADAPARRAAVRARRRMSRRSMVLAAVLLASIAVGDLAITRGDGATRAAAQSVGAASPPITIASPVARRLYDEGLARYYAGDNGESARLLGAALAEDSACAMCAYYAALADAGVDDLAAERMLELAMRLADRVSEPERLLIRYRWADATNSPARRALADSLAARYPAWPEAQLAVAEALDMAGDFLGAVGHLRRAIAGDPLGGVESSARCAACRARLLLVATYEAADSIPAALRVAQKLVQAQPRSRAAWLDLAHTLAESGRYDEAHAAMDSSTRYASGTDEDAIEHAQIAIRAGDFATADRLLRTLAETGNGERRSDALWFLLISLRDQGRLREALALSEGPMLRADSAATSGLGSAIVSEAQVLFELGQYRRAAAMFAANASPPDAFSRRAGGRAARQRVWMLTQAGSALAAAGDTAAVAMLADTVEAWGRKSGFGRDQRLHEYLRGLLWTARGRPADAVGAFRQAVLSETQGFSRLDLDLARALLEVGRPNEAIPVLRHGLGGTLEAGNFYATRTELQEMLARAYDAAGQADSAAAYYRRVVQAWRTADHQFRPRVARARTRLAMDERRLVAQR